MTDPTAMEWLVRLVREAGVEFVIRPSPVASGIMLQLRVYGPSGHTVYTTQHLIPDSDLGNLQPSIDELVLHTTKMLEANLRNHAAGRDDADSPVRGESIAQTCRDFPIPRAILDERWLAPRIAPPVCDMSWVSSLAATFDMGTS